MLLERHVKKQVPALPALTANHFNTWLCLLITSRPLHSSLMQLPAAYQSASQANGALVEVLAFEMHQYDHNVFSSLWVISLFFSDGFP